MKPRRPSGFTLVEAVLVMAVIGLLAAATAILIQPVLDSWTLDTPLNEATESSSFALDRMANEIAQLKDNTSVLTAEGGRFEFIDVDDDTIDYQVSGGNLMRNDDILLRDVEGLTFTYYSRNDNDGSEVEVIAVPDVSPAVTDIWRVEIELTVERQGQSVTLSSQVQPRNLPRS